MTLRHLRIYVAVCETGTLTAAGKKLYIAQPAISLAISELEGNYGVKFFDRISNRLHITDTGQQFLQYAQHIISLYEEMEHNIIDGDALGTLRIGSSISIANSILCDLVKCINEKHPKLKVNVIIQNSEIIEEKILDNSIDIGLIEGSVHSNYINTIDFMDDTLVFIAPLNHPLANKSQIDIWELQNEDFLLRELGSAGREIFDGLVDTYSLRINRMWQSTSTQAIIKGVANGFGLSMLPYLMVKESVESGMVSTFYLKDISLNRKFSVIHHKNKFLSQSTKEFIELCKVHKN
ncbi:MAG: LysR family transcriptional regulator [Eubacteriales bacterium]